MFRGQLCPKKTKKQLFGNGVLKTAENLTKIRITEQKMVTEIILITIFYNIY